MPDDEALLSEWAAHFRQAYCPDGDLDEMRSGTGLSRSEYLVELKFPPATGGTGPAVRSGDFAELLVTDYLEFELGFWTPRLKYSDKTNPGESKQGVDVLGFSWPDPEHGEAVDELFMFEVKSRLQSTSGADGLQSAIDGSASDYLRLGYTLNKTKQLLRSTGDRAAVERVERFQNKADRPFLSRSGAAAVFSDHVFDASALAATTTANHPRAQEVVLLVVRGGDLMALVHALYIRAADEA